MDERADRITFPARTWILLILFGVSMIVLLAANLVDIERQRQVAKHQLRLVERSFEGVGPSAARAKPLLGDLIDAVDPVKAGARRLDGLVKGLRVTDAPGAIQAAGQLATELNQRDRLVGLIDETRGFLSDARRAGLLANVQRLLDLARDNDANVRQSLRIQQQALDILRQSLAVQQETLEHARNLDRKTAAVPPAPVR